MARLHFDTGHPANTSYATRTACGRRIVGRIVERLHGLQGGIRQRLTTRVKAYATCKRCKAWHGTKARSLLSLSKDAPALHLDQSERPHQPPPAARRPATPARTAGLAPPGPRDRAPHPTPARRQGAVSTTWPHELTSFRERSQTLRCLRPMNECHSRQQRRRPQKTARSGLSILPGDHQRPSRLETHLMAPAISPQLPAKG